MSNTTIYKHLTPTALASHTLADRLNRSEYCWEGTSSRVVLTSPHRVTKVTSCPATAALLEELAACPVPGLPRVYRCLGVVAVDEDEPGAPGLKGFVLERLVHVDACGNNTACELYVQRALGIVGVSFGFSSAHDAELALELRDEPGLETSAAWGFLADFLLRRNAVLDAPLLRNVMLTREGKICLADPVSFNPTRL